MLIVLMAEQLWAGPVVTFCLYAKLLPANSNTSETS